MYSVAYCVQLHFVDDYDDIDDDHLNVTNDCVLSTQLSARGLGFLSGYPSAMLACSFICSFIWTDLVTTMSQEWLEQST